MHSSPPIRQSDQVRLAHAAPAGLRSAIESERQELLGLLSDLSDKDWLGPAAAGHWAVRDVALHLLDDIWVGCRGDEMAT